MIPAELRAHLARLAQQHADLKWPYARTQTLKDRLDEVAGDKASRYRLTRALFGVEKLADVGAPERWALWMWLIPAGLEPSAAEAAAVLAEYDAAQREAQREAQRDAGQLELL